MLKIEESYKDLDNIKARLSQKADAQIIDNFTNNLKGISQKIDNKMGKQDLEKTTFMFKNKLQELSKSIKNIAPKDQTDPYPLFTYNNKCIFCNQGVEVTSKVKQIIGAKYNDSEYLPKDRLYMPKTGGGYSKLLSSVRNEWELDQLFPPNTARSEVRRQPHLGQLNSLQVPGSSSILNIKSQQTKTRRVPKVNEHSP